MAQASGVQVGVVEELQEVLGTVRMENMDSRDREAEEAAEKVAAEGLR